MSAEPERGYVEVRCPCGGQWSGYVDSPTGTSAYGRWLDSHSECPGRKPATPRIFRCGGCGGPVADEDPEHVVYGVFAFHRRCVPGMGATDATAAEAGDGRDD